MNNYEFCVNWIIDNKKENNIRVLDYGCGAGRIVEELRQRRVNAFGCDVYYKGGDYSKEVDPALFGSFIKKMDEVQCIIPFDSASFDFVINNQVMEHVEDLDSVLAEILRVLKPGGMLLSLFADKGVWREGHCGIPFLHWFPKNSILRVYFAAAFRSLGFGYHKGNKSVMRWSQDFCEWLDKWTYYRSQEDIDLIYNKYFSDISHIEDHWLQLRLGRCKKVAAWLPTTTQLLVAKKLGCLVFVAHKPV